MDVETAHDADRIFRLRVVFLIARDIGLKQPIAKSTARSRNDGVRLEKKTDPARNIEVLTPGTGDENATSRSKIERSTMGSSRVQTQHEEMLREAQTQKDHSDGARTALTALVSNVEQLSQTGMRGNFGPELHGKLSEIQHKANAHLDRGDEKADNIIKHANTAAELEASAVGSIGAVSV